MKCAARSGKPCHEAPLCVHRFMSFKHISRVSKTSKCVSRRFQETSSVSRGFQEFQEHWTNFSKSNQFVLNHCWNRTCFAINNCTPLFQQFQSHFNGLMQCNTCCMSQVSFFLFLPQKKKTHIVNWIQEHFCKEVNTEMCFYHQCNHC